MIDPDQDRLEIRYGAYLPHWRKGHATYSVTFRLADSIPKPVLDAWHAEREALLKQAALINREPTSLVLQRLNYLLSEKVDAYLDAGHGVCWMKDDRIAKIVSDALLHFQDTRYNLLAWCVMPNHVHVVIRPMEEHSLEDILHSWKSYSAKMANRELNRSGEFWQTEYYDHLIRDETDFLRSIHYVLSNPEKAKLTHWKWVGKVC